MHGQTHGKFAAVPRPLAHCSYAAAEYDSMTVDKPILGFAFGEKGSARRPLTRGFQDYQDQTYGLWSDGPQP